MFASSETLTMLEDKQVTGIYESPHHSRKWDAYFKLFRLTQMVRIDESGREEEAKSEARELVLSIDDKFVRWVVNIEQGPTIVECTTLDSLRTLMSIWKTGSFVVASQQNGNKSDACFNSGLEKPISEEPSDQSEGLGDDISDFLALFKYWDKIFADWAADRPRVLAKDDKGTNPRYCHMLLSFGPDGPSQQKIDDAAVPHNPCGPKCDIDSALQVWSNLPPAAKQKARLALEKVRLPYFGRRWQVHAAWTVERKPRQSVVRRLLQRAILGSEMLKASRASAQSVMVIFVVHEDSPSVAKKKDDAILDAILAPSSTPFYPDPFAGTPAPYRASQPRCEFNGQHHGQHKAPVPIQCCALSRGAHPRHDSKALPHENCSCNQQKLAPAPHCCHCYQHFCCSTPRVPESGGMSWCPPLSNGLEGLEDILSPSPKKDKKEFKASRREQPDIDIEVLLGLKPASTAEEVLDLPPFSDDTIPASSVTDVD